MSTGDRKHDRFILTREKFNIYILEGARGFARLLGVNSTKTTKHVFNKIFLTIGGNLKIFPYKLSTPYWNP